MPLNPALDLQVELYDELLNHQGLIDLLGGEHIYDDVPQRSQMPYISFGKIETRRSDTQTGDGHEHFIILDVWSNHRGRKQVHEIIHMIDEALDDAELHLGDHNLVNLRVVFWSALRELDGKHYHGTVRLRAVTEPK